MPSSLILWISNTLPADAKHRDQEIGGMPIVEDGSH
jgi:hypothetical protein